MEEAMHLSKFGSKVYLLVRSNKLRASKAMQERVMTHPNIEILWNTECLEAKWDGDLLNEIQIINNQTQETSSLRVGGLFFAIGHTPNTWFLSGQVEIDETGYIVTQIEKNFNRIKINEKKEAFSNTLPLDRRKYKSWSSIPGVFAAWDVADKVYRQAITSAGTGCMAALEAESRLADTFSDSIH